MKYWWGFITILTVGLGISTPLHAGDPPRRGNMILTFHEGGPSKSKSDTNFRIHRKKGLVKWHNMKNFDRKPPRQRLFEVGSRKSDRLKRMRAYKKSTQKNGVDQAKLQEPSKE